MANFKMLFFRHYDRTIGDGTTTFSKMGIDKKDFTKMCSEPGFVLDEASIRRAGAAMKLAEAELQELIDAAAAERVEE